MASNNSKYSAEMREQTAKMIAESGKSATSMAELIKILYVVGREITGGCVNFRLMRQKRGSKK